MCSTPQYPSAQRRARQEPFHMHRKRSASTLPLHFRCMWNGGVAVVCPTLRFFFKTPIHLRSPLGISDDVHRRGPQVYRSFKKSAHQRFDQILWPKTTPREMHGVIGNDACVVRSSPPPIRHRFTFLYTFYCRRVCPTVSLRCKRG